MKKKTFKIGDAYITISIDPDGTWFIDDLFVPEDQRGKDVGRRLVRMVESYAKRKGATTIGIWAPEPSAFGFWRRVGYDEYGRKLL